MSSSPVMDVDDDENPSESEYASTQYTARSSQDRKSTYRTLLNKIEDIEDSEDLGFRAVADIHSIIKEVNELEDECNIVNRVSKSDETLLDSKVLSSASSLLVKCAGSVDVFSSSYEPLEFANKIIQFAEDITEQAFEERDILKCLPDALMLIPQVPEYRYLYGSYDLNNGPEVKKKKEKRLVQVKERYTTQKPVKITNIDKEEDDIDHIVKILYEVLKIEYKKNNKKPIKYYDYVTDNENFGNTIENMFYCSFLIRNGQAHIDLDERSIPIIKPIKKKVLDQYRQGTGANSQIISSITISEWEAYKSPGFIQQYRKENSTK